MSDKYPWVILDGEEEAHETLQEAMEAYADKAGWEDSIGYKVPMMATPCGPPTSLEIAMWLIKGLAERIPEQIWESWYAEEQDWPPPISDEYWPDLVRALLPYLDTAIAPASVFIFRHGEPIRLTSSEWDKYGLIVDDDGILRGVD